MVYKLLNNSHLGARWVPEPHTAVEVNVDDKVIISRETIFCDNFAST